MLELLGSRPGEANHEQWHTKEPSIRINPHSHLQRIPWDPLLKTLKPLASQTSSKDAAGARYKIRKHTHTHHLPPSKKQTRLVGEVRRALGQFHVHWSTQLVDLGTSLEGASQSIQSTRAHQAQTAYEILEKHPTEEPKKSSA